MVGRWFISYGVAAYFERDMLVSITPLKTKHDIGKSMKIPSFNRTYIDSSMVDFPLLCIYMDPRLLGKWFWGFELAPLLKMLFLLPRWDMWSFLWRGSSEEPKSPKLSQRNGHRSRRGNTLPPQSARSLGSVSSGKEVGITIACIYSIHICGNIPCI